MIQHEKCFQISKNKPSIGPVILETASVIWRQKLYILIFFLRLTRSQHVKD